MSRENQSPLPIILALITAMAPHTPGLPLWINLWCLALWGYMLLRMKTGWPLPGRIFRYTLTIVSILGLLATFRVQLGGDAFVGLLALMAAIKPFEMPTHRHRMITILLTYFIIITSLFRSDSLFILVYMLFSVFITTTALIRINTPDGSIKKSASLAFLIQAGALPLVLLLFLVFPRLPGSLVGLEDQSTATSGFSDRLSPGSVSRLLQDNTPAFRVEFQGEIPPAAQLYWRGIIFNTFDGRTWESVPSRFPARISSGQPPANVTTYTVLTPPHFSHRLMALDRPVQGPPWSRITRDGRLVSLKKIVQKTTYGAVSVLPDNSGQWHSPTPARQKAFAVKILETIPNPGTRQLALELGKNAATAGDKASALISHFNQGGFSYSTSPPRLGRAPVDEFLLRTKTGYCEHYAAAFAYMMNILGVPARVVGGYLGGELNPFANYLIVRQAYAHAWAEYYDPGRGWVRVDPTLAVSPDRITVHPDGSVVRTQRTALSLFNRTRYMMDALNLKWETWFTGYSLAEQLSWLNMLGLAKKGKGAGGLLALFTVLALAVFFILLAIATKFRKAPKDPVACAYDLFLKKMDRTGIIPAPGQGPLDFFQACMDKTPELAADIRPIMDLYVDLRYKRDTGKSPRAFAGSIRKFNPRPRPQKKEAT